MVLKEALESLKILIEKFGFKFYAFFAKTVSLLFE